MISNSMKLFDMIKGWNPDNKPIYGGLYSERMFEDVMKSYVDERNALIRKRKCM